MIDLLIVTALTEEAQVVDAILEAEGSFVEKKNFVGFYDYWLKSGHVVRLAAANAHHIGAVGMSGFVARLLSEIQPRATALVGIAAAVDATVVDLGDVPFTSQVISCDDIAVEDGNFTFRTQGYQVDPAMLKAVGELRTSQRSYLPWQEDCGRAIDKVVEAVNRLRRQQIELPLEIPAPHLVVEVTAGGPFLLRDKDFTDKLKTPANSTADHGISVVSPAHPKIVSAEMESHGFMSAAHQNGVPASVIKGISDDGNKEKAQLEKKTGGFFRTFACSNAVMALLHILQHYSWGGALSGKATQPSKRPSAAAEENATEAITPRRSAEQEKGQIAVKGTGSHKVLLPENSSTGRASLVAGACSAQPQTTLAVADSLPIPTPAAGWIEVRDLEPQSAVAPDAAIDAAAPIDLGMWWGLERSAFMGVVATRALNQAVCALVHAEHVLWQARNSVPDSPRLSARWWIAVQPERAPNGPSSFSALADASPNGDMPIPFFLRRHGTIRDVELGLVLQPSEFDDCKLLAARVGRWSDATAKLTGRCPAIVVEVHCEQGTGLLASRLRDELSSQGSDQLAELAIATVDIDTLRDIDNRARSAEESERRAALVDAVQQRACTDLLIDAWLQAHASDGTPLPIPRDLIPREGEPPLLDALVVGLIRNGAGPLAKSSLVGADALWELARTELKRIARLVDPRTALLSESFLASAEPAEVALALRANAPIAVTEAVLDAGGIRNPAPWWALCAAPVDEGLLEVLLSRPPAWRAVLGLLTEKERIAIANDATALEYIEACRRGRAFRRPETGLD